MAELLRQERNLLGCVAALLRGQAVLLVERVGLSRSGISDRLWHTHHIDSLLDEVAGRRECLLAQQFDHAKFALQICQYLFLLLFLVLHDLGVVGVALVD